MSRPAENQNTISSVLDSIESIPLVFFIGHAMASANWAGLDLGKLKISLDALSKRDWSDSFIFLVGCETAAIDAFAGDIGSMLIGRGARCVVGTLTKIRVDVAKIFFEEFFVMLLNGSPADYAFCLSRRKTVIYEAMRHGRNEDEAVALTEKVFGDVYEDMSTIVRKTGMSWSKIMKNSPYALSLTLLGGVGERLA